MKLVPCRANRFAFDDASTARRDRESLRSRRMNGWVSPSWADSYSDDFPQRHCCTDDGLSVCLTPIACN